MADIDSKKIKSDLDKVLNPFGKDTTESIASKHALYEDCKKYLEMLHQKSPRQLTHYIKMSKWYLADYIRREICHVTENKDNYDVEEECKSWNFVFVSVDEFLESQFKVPSQRDEPPAKSSSISRLDRSLDWMFEHIFEDSEYDYDDTLRYIVQKFI